MALCFMHNVYLCYLPAHCSHGLQPLDNGIFNVLKAAYRKELEKLASLTDSALVDKVNFIKAYAKARTAAFTQKNIASGWRVTGNWPILRARALRHAEISPDKEEVGVQGQGLFVPVLQEGDTPQVGRQICDLARNKTPGTRYQYAVIAKGFEAQEIKLASHTARIASLEEEVECLQRRKKRKAVPNPNRKFITVAEALGTSQAVETPILQAPGDETIIVADSDSESDALEEIEVSILPQLPARALRSGRLRKKARLA